MKSPTRWLDAESIKDSIEPHNFYLQEQSLIRFGYHSGNWVVAGHCPFHEDSKPGSFKINQETGAFKCWSCGASGGVIIAFLRLRDGLSFHEVLEELSRQWGVR